MTKASCRASSRTEAEPDIGDRTDGVDRGSFFKDYFNQPTRAEIGTMVAILEVGAFISSLSVGRIGDMIGRRKTILYGSVIFFIGGALQTFANGMPMMILGRIVAGFGVGALSTTSAATFRATTRGGYPCSCSVSWEFFWGWEA